VALVEQHLRWEDRREIEQGTGMGAPDVMVHGYVNSDPCFYARTVGDEPVCLFGVVPYPGLPGVGAVWLLGTDMISQVPGQFLRVSRGWIRLMMRRYSVLENRADSRNETHIRWLQWVGFSFISEEPFGPFSLPFLEFVKLKED